MAARLGIYRASTHCLINREKNPEFSIRFRWSQPQASQTFSAGGKLEKLTKSTDFTADIVRTLKPERIAVVHIGTKDTSSFHSFIDLFNYCKPVTYVDVGARGYDSYKALEIMEVAAKFG
ncbi:unnamed protein product [Prunus armeniaca]|uniref:Uncharacterized protein n=1 Tax=Prunus armeniaca TaxID=36596 RepID=A0A6J5V2T6_PRUAR|nr:unnamed protein product [Prunus armeniaca]